MTRRSLALTAVLMMATTKFSAEIPSGIQYVAIAPIGIGISHLIVLLVGKNKAS